MAKQEFFSNGAFKYGKLVLEIGILLFAVGLAWATIRGKVVVNTENLGKHESRIVSVESEQSEIKADIREIKVSQQYIKDGITEIKEKL